MPVERTITSVRGNDNLLRGRINDLRDYVGQDKAPIVTVTTNTTLDADDDGYTVLVDATSGNLTITLPLAADANERRYCIKKIDASGNTVTLDGNGAELIDGAANYVLSVQYQSVTVHSNGTAWWVT
jgi:hypothetical protein